MVSRGWVKQKLMRLAIGLGEEFVTDERLEIYADELCPCVSEEEFQKALERATTEMAHFPQLVDLFWFLDSVRWVEAGGEQERELRQMCVETATELPPSMRKRQ